MFGAFILFVLYQRHPIIIVDRGFPGECTGNCGVVYTDPHTPTPPKPTR
jgi:hypothetical protein